MILDTEAGRQAPRKRWLRRALGALVVASLPLCAYLTIQVPVRTVVRFRGARMTPPVANRSLEWSMSRATSHMATRRNLRVVPTAGIISPLYFSDLIDGAEIETLPTKVDDDGAVFDFSEHWLSLGAKQLVGAEVFVPASSPRNSVQVMLSFHGGEQSPVLNAKECPVSNGSGVRLRPRRASCQTETGAASIWGRVDLCPGADQVLELDTSPLPFLVLGEETWPYFDGPDACYSNLLTRESSLVPARLPSGGARLVFAIEDELSGTPVPPREGLQVATKLLSQTALESLSADCKRWEGMLSKTCWKAFKAASAGTCADVWPVTVDRTTVHVGVPSALGFYCHLLVALERPEGDTVHAMAFRLKTISSAVPGEPP